MEKSSQPNKLLVLADLKDHEMLKYILGDLMSISEEEYSIQDEPFKAQPGKTVVVVGEKRLNEVVKLRNITIHSGKIFQINKTSVIPIVSPQYIQKNPHKVQKYVDDIMVAYQESIGINKANKVNEHLIVQTMDDIRRLIKGVKQTGISSFDFETTKLTDKVTYDEKFYVRTLAISFQQGSAYVIPMKYLKKEGGLRVVVDSEDAEASSTEIMWLLEDEIFANPDIIKIAHNVKFDMHCLEWLGLESFRGPYHDTMVMHHIINEDESHKLKDIVKVYLPRYSGYEDDLIGLAWELIPLEQLAKYNALDADLTLRLWVIFTEIIMRDERLYKLYRNLLAPASKTLFNIECNGMKVDMNYLRKSINKVDQMIVRLMDKMLSTSEVIRYQRFKYTLDKEAFVARLRGLIEKEEAKEYKSTKAKENKEVRIEQWTEDIRGVLGGFKQIIQKDINLNSPTQLSELLYNRQGFGFTKATNLINVKSDLATSKAALEYVNDKSGFVNNLLAYRQLKLILKTYLKGIEDKVDDYGYIHTTFNQQVTKTGRLSSSKPNLQNIISRTKFKDVEEAVKCVKKSFIPPEGHTIMQADYSQVELRLVAHYANEKNMLKAYREDQDLHELTAARILGISIEDFKNLPEKEYKQKRYEAKSANFGLIYLMSPQGYMEYARVDYGITMSLRQAHKVRDTFFETYPKLLDYHQLYKQKALKFGYVRTMFGRKIHLPDIKSIQQFLRGLAERIAVNAPIQGSAGEMTVFALVLLDFVLPKSVLMVNTIHDSVISFIPNKQLEFVSPIFKEIMENLPLSQYFDKTINDVDMKVDTESSEVSWGELE